MTLSRVAAVALIALGIVLVGQAIFLATESRRHQAYRMARAAERIRRRALARATLGVGFIAVGALLFVGAERG